jgi:hypothetical protein
VARRPCCRRQPELAQRTAPLRQARRIGAAG